MIERIHTTQARWPPILRPPRSQAAPRRNLFRSATAHLATVALASVLVVSACGESPPPRPPDAALIIGVDDPDAGNLLDAADPGDASEHDGNAGEDVPDASDGDAAQADDASGFDANPSDGSTEADAGPDPCVDDGQTFRVAELLTLSSTEAEGLTVGVLGIAEAGEIACVGGPCSPSCCERCESGVLVDGRLPLLASECTLIAPGCRGSECGVVCSPVLLGVEERFVGRVRFTSADAPVLELLRVERP